MLFAAEAAKKKKAKSYSRSQFTAEQREKIAERGRAQCRKKFGATSRLYRVDYMHGKFWCSSYH